MNTRILGSALLVASAALAVSACEKKQANKPDGVQVEDPVKKAVRRADLPRAFPQKVGAGEGAEVQTFEVDALGVLELDGVTYARFDVGKKDLYGVNNVRVDGGVSSVCLGEESNERTFIVRLRSRPDTVKVRWGSVQRSKQGQGYARGQGETEATLDDAPTEDGLDKKFFECAREDFWSKRDGVAAEYYVYGSQRLHAMAVGNEEAESRGDALLRRRRMAARPNDLEQMMDLYTGMTSLEEALQTDRGLRTSATTQTRDVSLGTIEGVGIAAHPWGEMINELGRESEHAPMAEVVPYDMAYVHFHDVRDFVRTARRFEEVVLPAAAALEGGAGSSSMSARYERELIMRRTSISEAMGDVAVKSFAIVTSDPFLREGADVSLMFEVNNEAALLATLAKFVAEAKSERSDLTESSYEVGGLTATLWSTPDGAHRRHMVRVNDVLVVSNSRAAVARIVETAAGKRDALTTRGDFDYMRALYPFSEEGEDGFVFIGDDFVREAISPRAKILSSRRVRARADLMAVNSAALLHGWLEGAPPESVDEMLKSRALAPGMTKTFEGEAITFTKEGGARSARWGTVGALTPLIEVGLKAATKQEAEAYGVFKEGYQEYWRQFIDPIGVRLRWSGEGELEVDARMLPLIEGTSYDELIELVGRKRLVLERPPMAGVAFFYGLGEGVSLRGDLNKFVDDLTDNDDLNIDWAGDWVGFGVGDRSGLWDVAAAFGEIPMRGGSGAKFRGWDGLFYAAARMPLWGMVKVKDGATLERALAGLEAEVARNVDDVLTWSPGAPYRDAQTYAIVEDVLRTRRGDPNMVLIPPLDLHYAIAGGVLVLALERELLEEKIDDVLDGRIPEALAKDVEALPNLSDSGTQATMTVMPWPEDSHLVDTTAGLMESSMMRGSGASAGMIHVLAGALGAAALGSPEAIDAAAMVYFGLTPYAPHGAGWAVGEGLEVSHGRYGSVARPSILSVPVEGSPVTALLESLVGLEMSIGFDGDGTHRGLHTKLRWRSR